MFAQVLTVHSHNQTVDGTFTLIDFHDQSTRMA